MKSIRVSAALICVLMLAGVAAPRLFAQSGEATCSRIDTNFGDDLETVRADQVMTAPAAQVSVLRAAGVHNGGITVQGWDRPEYVVHACKAAGAATQEEAASILSQITASFSGGTLQAQGPADSRWSVFFVINAPRAATMELEVGNGPVSVRETTGKVTIEAENGPIAIKNCSGEVQATAQNGPISLTGDSGSLKVKTQNGPIHVQLAGTSWQGAGLDASAVNGPLTVELPSNYSSGVVIETSGRSPFSCRAKGCENARANFDDELRSIQLGGGAPAVHLSTVNGPVSVRDRRAEM